MITYKELKILEEVFHESHQTTLIVNQAVEAFPFPTDVYNNAKMNEDEPLNVA
jgi:hypothetical protein